MFSVDPVQEPTHGTLGSIENVDCVSGSPHTDGATVTYTPELDYIGSDFFTYKINDGESDSNTATVYITVGSLTNEMYVSDIVFESRTRGKGGAKHNERIVVTVRRDADGNGADTDDQLISGSSMTVELTGPDNYFATYSGGTNSSGIFRTGWASNLLPGTYVAEVTALTHATYAWDQDLDPTVNNTDLDNDELPDQEHLIP